MSDTFLFLLFFMMTSSLVSSATAMDSKDICPENCTCWTSNHNDLLQIDCASRTTGNVIKLEEEINEMLMSMPSLMKLTIMSTQLTRVPERVCDQTLLQSFTINRNRQLSGLPDNCLVRMKNLVVFDAKENNISHLQDGLFDGLMSLEEIYFNNNQIESIGLYVFSNVSDLLHLKSIQLSKNLLQYVEPWPFIRGQAVPGVMVDLTDNLIEEFTNELGWIFRKSMQRIRMTLGMSSNNIHRVADLIRALNFSDQIDFMRFLVDEKVQETFVFDSTKAWSFHTQRGYICDCQDFVLFSSFNLFQRSHNPLAGTTCSNFDYASQGSWWLGSYTDRIPLDQLVCVVTTGCPKQCHCMNQPSNGTFHILCSKSGLTHLPDDVPPTYLPRSPLKSNHEYYKLDFSGSNIRTLLPQKYFNNTTVLDLSNSHLENITDEALLQLTKTDKIYLHNNLLTTLPLVVQSLNFTFTQLSLYGNPLWCGCGQVWLKTWLTSVYDQLVNPQSIQCNAPHWLKGKVIFSVNSAEFCRDPNVFDTKMWSSLVASLSASLVIVIVIGVLMFHFRVLLHTEFGIHPFDRDECNSEQMEYDVFLSYAHKDKITANELRMFLESKSLRVLYHERDFIAGYTILDNINQVIKISKRVLCLVSDNYLESGYGLREFNMALHHHSRMKCKRLRVVLTEDFDSKKFEQKISMEQSEPEVVEEPTERTSLVHKTTSPGLPDSGLVKQFLSHNTYVKYSSDNDYWKNELLYSMPMKRMCTKFAIHPFDRDECNGEQMDNDVFLSYADQDEVIARKLLEFLESNSLRVLYHERDFLGGNATVDNITDGIVRSKRVVCLVSENYLKSQYGLHVFISAFDHHIKIKCKRLIAVLTEEFDLKKFKVEEVIPIESITLTSTMSSGSSHLAMAPESSQVSEQSLKQFLSNHTYVVANYRLHWWKKQLLNSMPTKRMGKRPEESIRMSDRFQSSNPGVTSHRSCRSCLYDRISDALLLDGC